MRLRVSNALGALTSDDDDDITSFPVPSYPVSAVSTGTSDISSSTTQPTRCAFLVFVFQSKCKASMRLAIAKVKSADMPQLVMDDSFVVNYVEKERDLGMYICSLDIGRLAIKDVTIPVMCLDIWIKLVRGIQHATNPIFGNRDCLVSSLKVELVKCIDYNKVLTKSDNRVECSSKGSRAPTTTFALQTNNLHATSGSRSVSQNRGRNRTHRGGHH